MYNIICRLTNGLWCFNMILHWYCKRLAFIIVFMNIYYINGYDATNIGAFSSIQFLGYKNMGIDTKIIALSLL